MSARQSIRDSMRFEGRDWSLLAAAGALALFGLAVNNSILPNYHEQQGAHRRLGELQRQHHAAAAESERLRDEILSLEDPYYLAEQMVTVYRWRYAPPNPDVRTP